MQKIGILISMVVWCACGNTTTTEQNKKQDPNRIYVAAPNRMYFLNVRSIYYDKETNTAAQLDYYRFGDRIKTDQQPVLNLAIVDAWMREEAYLVVEPNNFFEDKDSVAIRWEDIDNGTKGYFYYVRESPKMDYEFVRGLYTYVLKPNIKLSYKKKPLLTGEQKNAFRKTYKDFENLIAKK